jgi:hypothetical protein
VLRLENPKQQRSIASIMAGLSDDDRANVAKRLIRLSQALDRQDKFDEQVAASLDRILSLPRYRPLAKQIRKRIKEVAANAL